MLIETLIQLFKRDLNKLKEEINLYQDEKNLWKINGSVNNSAGNLCLHIIGNLNHFIGATLGNSGYVRARNLEFSLKDVKRSEMNNKVESTIALVEDTLKKLKEEDLQAQYKHRVFNEPMTTAFFLMHLTTHLAYHLGQINYHRRLLDK